MIRLDRTLASWGTPEFEGVARGEIGALDPGLLPLQQGLSATSCVSDDPHQAMIIGAREDGGVIRVRAGIFYRGIVAGCSCADDPTPLEAQNEYCVLQFDIDRTTGAAAVSLLEE